MTQSIRPTQLHRQETSAIFRLAGRLQRQHRSMSGAPGLPLSLGEIHCLIELATDPRRSIPELAETLALDQATVSKVVTRLQDRKFLKRRTSKDDARLHEITLTPAGEKAIGRADLLADQSLNTLTKHLSRDEVRSLKRLFGTIAQGLGVPPAREREHEHPLRATERHMTRALGLLRDALPGTNTSITEWQALSILAFARSPKTANQLAAELGVSPVTAGQVIPRLERRGLVKRVGKAAKGAQLVATEAAREGLEALEAPVVDQISKAMAHIGADELRRSRLLLERFLGNIGEGEFRLPSGLLALVVTDDQQLNGIRGAVLRALVATGLEDRAPYQIVDPESRNVALYDEATLVGFAQLRGEELVLLCTWHHNAKRIEDQLLQAVESLLGVKSDGQGLVVHAGLRRDAEAAAHAG